MKNESFHNPVEASTYDLTYHSHIRHDVLHLLPPSCDRILEIGLGTGGTIEAIGKLKPVTFCAGVELNPDVAALARPRVNEVIVGDIERLDLPDHWTDFDVILCLDVLEHLVDPWSVVGALHKRLKPGGAIIASLPNVNFRKVVFPLLLLGKWELQDAGVLDRTHLRFFVRETSAQLMTSSGLQLDRIEAGGMPQGGKWWWFNRITGALFERFIAQQTIVRVVSKAIS